MSAKQGYTNARLRLYAGQLAPKRALQMQARAASMEVDERMDVQSVRNKRALADVFEPHSVAVFTAFVLKMALSVSDSD